MEELLEKLYLINDNLWNLRYEEQLQVINMYLNFITSKGYSRKNIIELIEYSENLTAVLKFKEEYSKLNSTGRKFIRTNMNNRFSSEGYRNSLNGEKYGCYSKNGNDEVILDKFNKKHRQIEITPELVQYYILTFHTLDKHTKSSIIGGWFNNHWFLDYSLKAFGYPVKMKDDFNCEMYELLRENYVEYEKMTPDKRMEFIKYLVENQIPRALKYMDETDTRRKLIKMGRNEENVKRLSLCK